MKFATLRSQIHLDFLVYPVILNVTRLHLTEKKLLTVNYYKFNSLHLDRKMTNRWKYYHFLKFWLNTAWASWKRKPKASPQMTPPSPRIQKIIMMKRLKENCKFIFKFWFNSSWASRKRKAKSSRRWKGTPPPQKKIRKTLKKIINFLNFG